MNVNEPCNKKSSDDMNRRSARKQNSNEKENVLRSVKIQRKLHKGKLLRSEDSILGRRSSSDRLLNKIILSSFRLQTDMSLEERDLLQNNVRCKITTDLPISPFVTPLDRRRRGCLS